MKAIISFNDEYLDLCFCQALDNEESEESINTFRNHVILRALALGVCESQEQVEVMIEGENDTVNFNTYGNEASASIRFGDYFEYLKLTDIPEREGMEDERGDM